MNDNDIIKAMKYCSVNFNAMERCTEDVCYQSVLPEERNGDIRWCRQWLIKDALDLINRQKAEIERLQKRKQAKCGTCAYAMPTTAFGGSICYIECTNKEHIAKYCHRHEISKVRQRTNPACKSYVEKGKTPENQ